MPAAVRIVALAVVSALLAACAATDPQIRVDGAWSRPTGSEDSPGVVYVSIANDGGSADRLVGATSERCEAVEIHETRVVDDRMRMVPVTEGVVIGPRSTVALEPGGLHVMLLGLHGRLRVGESFDVRLDFERSGVVPVEVEVRRP